MTITSLRHHVVIPLLLLIAAATASADTDLKVLPYVGEQSRELKEWLDNFTLQYAEAHSLVSKDYPYKPAESTKDFLPLYWHFGPKNAKYKEASTLYTLKANGRNHLAGIIAYNPLLKAEPHCKPNDSIDPAGHCEWIAQRALTCHLFLLSPTGRQLESMTPLNIARDPKLIKGWPRCSKVLAIAPAKIHPNAFLLTLGYFDSAAPADPRMEPPEFRTTLLVQMPAEKKVIQDDDCLGNPNMLSSINAARKALSACNKADTRIDYGEAEWIDFTDIQSR